MMRAGVPGNRFSGVQARESARTRAPSSGSPLGRLVLGVLDFLGGAVGRDATADAAFPMFLSKKSVSAGSVGSLL